MGGSPEKSARNAAMYAMHRAGATYREIAQQFGLSLGRTEKIIWREKRRQEVR